jgi:hypothetical protein
VSLERADFIVLVHGLQGLEGELGNVGRADRAAWPYVVNGLSANPSGLARRQVAAAAAASAAITVPAVLEEADAAALTGPASPIGGLFGTFIRLVPRGWKLIEAAISEIQGGPEVDRAFARETVDLYIESVYDGSFTLAQIGRRLPGAYKDLGGPEALGGQLSEREVESLVAFYSESQFRLHPHTGVKLGS